MQKCVWYFYYFDLERKHDVLKSKIPRFLLNKNMNFSKSETESIMENDTHTFRETNLELQHISKTVVSWSSRKKAEYVFCTILFSPKESFCNICVLSQCVVY